MYEKQKGICPHCKSEKREKIHYELEEMEADHITPWSEGEKLKFLAGRCCVGNTIAVSLTNEPHPKKDN